MRVAFVINESVSESVPRIFNTKQQFKIRSPTQHDTRRLSINTILLNYTAGTEVVTSDLVDQSNKRKQCIDQAPGRLIFQRK